MLPMKLLLSLVASCALLAACGPSAARNPAPAPGAAATRGEAKPAPDTVAGRLRAVAGEVDSALTALDAGDIAKARQAYEKYDEGWEGVEDDVKAKSPDAYKAIEDAMDEVEAALTKVDKPDPTRARDALTKLKQAIRTNIAALR